MQICTSLQTDNHASTPPLRFLQAGCPSCCPTSGIKPLKALADLYYGHKMVVVVYLHALLDVFSFVSPLPF